MNAYTKASIGIFLLSAGSPASAATIFSNDFSQGLSSRESVTGRFSVADGYLGHHSGYWNNETDTYTISGLNLAGATQAVLKFDYSLSLEPGFDRLFVNVSGGPTLAVYTGSPRGTATLDFTQFANANTMLTFQFTSDGSIDSGNGYTGVHLDNVSVTESVSAVPLPASAPMFGAALLGLAGLGYAAKRKKVAAAA